MRRRRTGCRAPWSDVAASVLCARAFAPSLRVPVSALSGSRARGQGAFAIAFVLNLDQTPHRRARWAWPVAVVFVGRSCSPFVGDTRPVPNQQALDGVVGGG